MTSDRYARRAALLLPVLVLTIAAAGCSSDSGDSKTSVPSSGSTSAPADPSGLGKSTTTPAAEPVVPTTFPTKQGLPLSEPPVITATDGVLSTTFDAHEATFDVAGQQVRGKTYGPGILGPTLVVAPGDRIEIVVKNNLAETTNFHTHGLHTSPIGISDNVLRVMPESSGNEVVINVPLDAPPGTYWYHAHLHGLTEEQVFSGLAGTLIVDGLSDLLPAGLQNAPEHLIALRDVQLDSDGAIVTENIDSNAPTTRTINGQVNPVINGVAGQAMLLRIGDMSADIWYRLHLDGAQFTVIAEDANPMGEVETRDELLLPPGKRYDVLVRWDQPGTFRLRTLRYSTGPAGDDYPDRTLATFVIDASDDNATPPIPAMPTTMGALPDLENDPIAKRRTVVFSENDSGFFINDKEFSANRVLFNPKLGTTEEWTIRNTTKEEHPFHIHVNDFQVMSINGKPVAAKSLRDTQALPVGGEVVIRMRFTQFLGRYVFHCHILAHEDAGMMAIIDITKDGKPSPAPSTETHTMP